MLLVDGTGFDQQAAEDAAPCRVSNKLLLERVHGEGRARELGVFPAHGGQHAAIVNGSLGGVVDQAEKVERAASILALLIGIAQILDETGGEASLFGEFILQRLAAAGEVTGNGEAGIDGREELGFFLDYLRESFFYEAVEHLIDLLARDMRARREFKGFEPG